LEKNRRLKKFMPKYLTPEGLEKLKKELDYLKRVKRKEIAQKLKHAISFGDLSENAAYREAKEAQAFLEGKILELEDIIRSANVFKSKKNGQVEIGSRVLIKSNHDKQILKFKIVGAPETDPLEGKISYESPLGKALFGKHKGAIIKVKTPEGKIQYQILEIK